MSPVKRFLGARFFPAVLFLFGAVCLYAGADNLAKGWASRGWPAVAGVVTSAKVGINDTRMPGQSSGAQQVTPTYYPDIIYTYSIGETRHEGYQVSFGEYADADRSIAEEILDRYREGAAVQVYYNPDRPGEAVLEPGLHGFPWLFLIPAPIFLGLGYLMAKYFPGAAK